MSLFSPLACRHLSIPECITLYLDLTITKSEVTGIVIVYFFNEYLDKIFLQCLSLTHTLQSTDIEVEFINVSMNALGAFDSHCNSLLSMLNDLDTPYSLRNHLISKMRFT